MRVLIADDNPVVRRVLQQLVEKQTGFEVCASVADGDECLEYINQDRPDVISLDLEMPRMSGRTVLMKMLERNLHLGVVVVTGLPIHDQPSVQDELRSLGAYTILSKDFSPSGNDLGLFTKNYFSALKNAAANNR
ncbi:MAG: response regulator [Calditrichaeota bacterium]|nr:response regulator [Calditrichota bacterium]